MMSQNFEKKAKTPSGFICNCKASHLTLSNTEGQIQGHSEDVLKEMSSYVTINTYRKQYMESPVIPSDLTLSGIDRSNSRSLRFRRHIYLARVGPLHYY